MWHTGWEHRFDDDHDRKAGPAPSETQHLGARHLGVDIWAQCHMGARTFGARNTFKGIFNQLFVSFILNKYKLFCLQRSYPMLNFLFATISLKKLRCVN